MRDLLFNKRVRRWWRNADPLWLWLSWSWCSGALSLLLDDLLLLLLLGLCLGHGCLLLMDSRPETTDVACLKTMVLDSGPNIAGVNVIC